MTPTSGGPPSGGEEGTEACLLNPASTTPETLDTPTSANVALSQETVCVATTSRIRRSPYGVIVLGSVGPMVVYYGEGRPWLC